MSPAPRGRSLFWTFAGVLLVVLVTATALQIVISLAVVRPLALQNERARARDVVSRAARQLALVPADDVVALIDVLQANRVEGGSSVLLFMPEGRRWIPDRPIPPPMMRQIRVLSVAAGITAPGAGPESSPQPGGPGFGGPRDEYAPPGGPRDGARPDGRPRFDDPGRGPERPEYGAAERNEPAPPFQPRETKLVLLAHEDVRSGGRSLGTLIAVGSAPTSSVWTSPESRALLLFMPFAVIAAGLAALLMVRIMVRRLDALERVATRVADGDLTARVETTGQDEIGRLEERINRMTDRLQAARDQLAETDRQRRRLLADITHELATPLTSIRGYVETLLNPDVPLAADEPKQYLRDALAESERMDLLIHDLIELARLEAGAQPLARVRLDWAGLCRNTVRRFEPRFQAARLRLEWTGDTGEAWIVADGRRMEQLVENLMGNALRYVPAGGSVSVGLTRLDDPAGAWFRLVVRDDGPGILPEDLPHVFDRFYRARNVREVDGTGLGLAIVREIVERHGGRVHAERAAPRGAAFVVELPGA